MNRRRIAVAVVLAALGVAAPVFAAGGAGVVVIRSSDAAPFKQVQQGFEAALGQPVKSFSLRDGSAEDATAAAQHAAVVLAIGPEAAALAMRIKPASLIRAMVPGSAAEQVVPIYAEPSQQVRVISELLPRARRIGIVYDPAQSAGVVADYSAAASNAGLSIHKAQARSREDVAAAVRTLAGSVDALWLVPDTTVVSADTFKFMVQLSLSQKVPLIGFSKGMAKSGALMAMEASYVDIGKRAAEAARKALAGSVPTPEPARGAIYLNSSSADLLGVAIPDSLKDQAGAVFE